MDQDIPSHIKSSSQTKDQKLKSASTSFIAQKETYERILSEFDSLGKDSSLSFAQIQNFLSEKQKEEFDVILCQELVARLDKNSDDLITPQEFSQSYVEVVSLIIKEISSLKLEIEKNTKELESTYEKLANIRTTEVLNEDGIMNGSLVTVMVKSAQDLSPALSNSLASPYVAIECENERAETGVIKNTLNPVWDEVFTLPVTKKTSVIKFTVMTKTLIAQKPIGTAFVPLKVLVDQIKHNEEFSLLDPDEPNKSQGSLSLELQWIWSRVRYLQDITEDWKNIIQEDKDHVESLTVQLNKLKKPFEKEIEPLDYADLDISYKSPYSERYSRNTSENYSLPDDKLTNKYLFIVVLVYVAFSVLSTFIRPDFLNVISI